MATDDISNYRETLDFLYSSLPVFQQQGASAYKPGLGNTLAFCEMLGRPDRNFTSIHVAGTNGKGSTSHMLASILQAAGYRTGLFTSPHLKDFRERIRINGRTISEQEVLEFTAQHRAAMVARGLTFFEMCTLLAFDRFAAHGVEVAVIETGLGGRLDATNIITPALSIITNIGLDHTDLLGKTVQEIAFEKAGIIKPGVPVIISERDPQTEAIFMKKAAECASPLYFAQQTCQVVDAAETPHGQCITVTSPWDVRMSFETDLPGDYQKRNLPGVLAACHLLQDRMEIPLQAIQAGCRDAARTTGLKGRWQILGRDPLTVCDTGHNAHGIKEVVAQIGRQKFLRLWFVLGVLGDRDLSTILPLLPRDASYIFTQAATPRALPCEALAREAARHGLHGNIAANVPEALKMARCMARPDDMIFVGGSTYTVADIPDL